MWANSAANFAAYNSDASQNALKHCEADTSSRGDSATNSSSAANTIPGAEPPWSIAGDCCHSVLRRITFARGDGHTDYSEFESPYA